MKDVVLYWSPGCSTCQKAARWLDRHNVKVTKLRDIKDEPLSRSEIEALAKMVVVRRPFLQASGKIS
jgi:arsenate reductase-like glutaredoxin family protein